MYVVAECVGSRREFDRDIGARADATGGRADRDARDGRLRVARRGGNAALSRRQQGVLPADELHRCPGRAWARAMAGVSLARGRSSARSSRYARWLEEKLERRHDAAGRRRGDRGARAARPDRRRRVHGLLAAAHPLLGLLWDIAVLYLLMGFRRFSHAYTDDRRWRSRTATSHAARRALAAWRGAASGDLSSERRGEARDRARAARLVPAGVRARSSGSRCCPALPAPCCIAPRRCWPRSGAPMHGASDVTPIARARAVFGAPARRLLWLLDWIPVRLTALSFAIVGDFEDAASLLAHAGGELGRAGRRRARGHPSRERWRARSAWCSAGRCRSPAASPSTGPSSAWASRRTRDLLPSGGRPRLARAGALAAVDAAAYARVLGALSALGARHGRGSRATSVCSSATRCARNVACVDGFAHRASGLAVVTAIAKAAVAEQRSQLDERARRGRPARHARGRTPSCPANRRSSRRPLAAGQRIQRRMRRRVPPGGKRGGHFAGLRVGVGCERVQDRRLAHARLADEHGVRARKPREERRRVARGCQRARPDSRAPRTAARRASSSANSGRSDLFAASTNAAALRLGGDRSSDG